MSLTLELSPEVENRLEEEAKRVGVAPPEYVSRLIEERLPLLTDKQKKLVALLDQWDKEDETDDLGEIARRQAEWEEFKESINRHHESDRLIYP